MSEQTPAGFYDDGSGTQRYWDGSAWGITLAEATRAVAPAVNAPSSAAPPQNSQPRWVWAAGLGVVVLLALVAVLLIGHHNSPSAVAATTPSPTVSATSKPTPKPTPTVMTKSQAAAYYLTIDAPVSKVSDRLKTWAAGGGTDVSTLRSLEAQYAGANKTFISQLQAAKWPSSAEPAAQTLAAQEAQSNVCALKFAMVRTYDEAMALGNSASCAGVAGDVPVENLLRAQLGLPSVAT